MRCNSFGTQSVEVSLCGILFVLGGYCYAPSVFLPLSLVCFFLGTEKLGMEACVDHRVNLLSCSLKLV